VKKSKPTVLRREEHTVSRRDINPDALKVLYRLHRAGYKAYLVGGGVRDLLLGRHPKDFDISTNAHPRQIKKLFRNCFLIGRRFRLAHIRFGDHVVETSTFRRDPPPEGDGHFRSRDNTFGTPAEDARRRDFTINGLFYDIRDFSVIDYVGGLPDLERGVVRCIGDPNVRFQEDPVRMLRAVRFASRLGFRMERRTYKALCRYRGELAKASKPRLVEEVYKLFGFGAGEAAFRLLHETRLLDVMMPQLAEDLKHSRTQAALMWRMLAALDADEAVVSPPSQPLMLGALLYAGVERQLTRARAHGQRVEVAALARDVLQPMALEMQMPKRVFYRIVQMIAAVDRMCQAGQRRYSRHRMLSLEQFPESLALFQLAVRAQDGRDAATLDEWLTLFAEQGQAPQPAQRRRPRRRPRRRRPRGGSGRRGPSAPA
jgi:poly(A) polymerase